MEKKKEIISKICHILLEVQFRYYSLQNDIIGIKMLILEKLI